MTLPPSLSLFVVGVNDPGLIEPPEPGMIFPTHREPLWVTTY
jgi:hypothetical protein